MEKARNAYHSFALVTNVIIPPGSQLLALSAHEISITDKISLFAK